MKKTTSMSEITFDLVTAGSDHRVLAMASPRFHRRHSSDLQDTTAEFLRACSLCNRPLVHGRDIYMYRGDKAFCSEECRQQQMKQDERMEKCSTVAAKKLAAAAAASVSAQISGKGETVAAAS